MNNPTNASDHSRIARTPEAVPSISAFPALPLAMMGRYQAREGEHFAPHHHVGHELIVWRSGTIRCEIGQHQNRQVVHTYPGMVTLVPGGIVHTDIATSAYDHVYALFSADLPLPGLDRPRVYHDTATGDLEQLLLSLEHEFNSRASHRDEMVALLSRQLIIRLLRLEEQQDITPAEVLVQQAERLLTERHASNPDLQALAAELGVSPATLRAKFVQIRAYSPKTFLTRVRVKHALGHIRNSSLSLENVATMLGYASSGHLWRDVKLVTGRPPGAFRRASPEPPDTDGMGAVPVSPLS